jgi:4-diphosphocytidyl-2-C-methyl-D-erythritol kinase
MNIIINANAKINLKLKVLGDLPDGYHDLYNHMQAGSLADRVDVDHHDLGKLEAEEADGYAPRIILHPGKPYLPRDERNLAWQAAVLMHRTYHPDRKEKIYISVEKNIPVAAGLAGGSSDGAAVLSALALLWGILPGYTPAVDVDSPENGSQERKNAPVYSYKQSGRPTLKQLAPLLDLAAQLGSDVPFCLMAQHGYTAAIGTGRGTDLKLTDPAKYRVLLYTPAFPLSTKAVFKEWKEGDQSEFNDLEEPAIRLSPEIADILQFMAEIESPCRTMLSGSGPTVVNLYEPGQRIPNRRTLEEAFINRQGNVFLGECI